MKLKRRIFVTVAVFIVGCSIGFLVWSSGPSKQTVDNKTEVKGATTEAVQTIGNDYLLMQIPGRFRLKTENKPSTKPIYLQQLYTVPVTSVNTIFGEQFAITIGDTLDQPINEIPAVQLRLRHSTYRQLNDVFEPGVIAFESTEQGYEVSVFLVHDSTYVALVLTEQTAHAEQAVNEMKAILQTLTWL